MDTGWGVTNHTPHDRTDSQRCPPLHSLLQCGVLSEAFSPPPSFPPADFFKATAPLSRTLGVLPFKAPLPPPSVACKSNSEQMCIVIPLPPPCLTVVVAGCLAAVWFEGALDGSAEGPGEDGNTKRFNLFLSLSVPLQTHGRSLFPL